MFFKWISGENGCHDPGRNTESGSGSKIGFELETAKTVMTFNIFVLTWRSVSICENKGS